MRIGNMSSRSQTPRTGYESHETRSSSATSLPSSPEPKFMSHNGSNAISDDMLAEEKRMQKASKIQKRKEEKRSEKWENADAKQHDAEYKKLTFLMDKAKIFSSIMRANMEKREQQTQKRDTAERRRLERKESQAEQVAVASQRRATRASAVPGDGVHDEGNQSVNNKSSKASNHKTLRRTVKQELGQPLLTMEELKDRSNGLSVAEAMAEEVAEQDAKPTALGVQDLRPADQPKAVTGGIMRGYQLKGLDWLASLYENGLNGILADEMGLGKTIQTISLLAFLRERGTNGPFLIVAPLSTLGNWIDEFAKWTPSIPTVLYHGPPAQRNELRDRSMKNERRDDFPVVCTSYEICMNDRKFLAAHQWKFIIIDEGHRLKNLNCRLIKELKEYKSANRLLITGTPLQNNLTELWSLLNFLMPEVFDTLENFESLFDFSAILEKNGHEEIARKGQKSSLIASLHAILKPFLLRRVKTDVETDLPKKREYILYAPLTMEQKELYRQILDGNSRAYLEQQAIARIMEKAGDDSKSSRDVSRKRKLNDSRFSTPNKSLKSSRSSTPAGSVRSVRTGRKTAKNRNYKEVSDREYFEQIEQSSESSDSEDEEEQAEAERTKTIELAKKEIANKKLQNPIMQLRLACNSPHNFYWPWPQDQTPDQTLISSSGKMLLLERLVPYLFSKGHKVLIFSQFTTQLDILEDWATILHAWSICRIDGTTPQDDRKQSIDAFNTSPETKLFLLSTRSGGQGINLTAADTVILYDSDWNPQQDLQAQDRAHRIGQTRPVIVYRLATKNTVEQNLLEKADGKRRLEKLVIQKGKFRSLLGGAGAGAGIDDAAELARILQQDDFEGYEPGEAGGEDILGDDDLAILTDRSEKAYARAEKGLDVGGQKFRAVEAKMVDDGLLGEVV